MSAGDLQFIDDGKASKWVNFPVGFQVGKVLKLGQLPVRFSVNPQYHLLDRDGSSKWSVGGCDFKWVRREKKNAE